MKVHLCGSIGLDSVDGVLAAVGRLLKDHVVRVPDGEPGGRRLWIGWQYAVVRSSPYLEIEGVAADELRRAGVLAQDAKFQVSLPTPYAVAGSYITPAALPVVEPAYEAAMLLEVERICAAIPPGDLCIQWDVCTEMIMLDGRSPRINPSTWQSSSR